MTLRKTKASIVINAIYVLVASALCIITIMDAAEGFGFSYLPGLIAFAVIMALGLGLKKVLSFTAGSDKFKALTEKGDLIGIIIFAVLLVFSIIFRFVFYSSNGLGGNVYFELAKVTGGEMRHYVHASDDWYLTILHGIFFLFGNRVFIAAIFNCVLQLAAVILGFAAFRKMLGIVPALFFTAFWTITGFSVHEALTLNSRNLVFLLVTLTLFVLSTCIPASTGKFFSYLISGLLVAVCIYADIAGLVLIPFIFGILLNDMSEEDDNSFGLRMSKMFFTLVSVVFGLVLLIFVDSYLTSSNPFTTLSSICSLYKPSGMFSLGFSYMTSYSEIVIMAFIAALGIFVCFFSEEENRLILMLSVIMILIINNFGMTYLENDGREIFFMLGALIAGISFRELFPAQITGDVFKASAEMYDNEFSAPDKGYVPSGLKNAAPSIEFDDLSDLDIKPEPDPVSPETGEEMQSDSKEAVNSESSDKGSAGNTYDGFVQPPVSDVHPSAADAQSSVSAAQSASSDSQSSAETPREYTPMEMFDAVILPRPGQDTKPHISQGQLTSQAIQASLPPEQPAEAPAAVPSHASQVSFASGTTTENDNAQTLQETSSAETAAEPEEKKKSVYVPYGKPQLKPEYRRRPGAWMQALNEKNKAAGVSQEIKLGTQNNKDDEAKSDSAPVNDPAKVNDPEVKTVQIKTGVSDADEVQSAASQKNEAGKESAHAPEIAPNGAVLLENPIPHPARKTERKVMEYDVDLNDSNSDYDIKISDDDDYDV